MVLTDSGGLQEEITVLGNPVHHNERKYKRPIICEIGTNVIVGNKPDKILAEAEKILNGTRPKGKVPDKWDVEAEILF